MAAGLLWRATLEAGVGLSRTPVPADAPGATPPFAGVTVELAGQPAATVAERLDALRSAGFGWVRQPFDWRRIEAVRGQFDWTEADRLVAAITAAGLEPVAVLNTTPQWALAPADRTAGNSLAPPADFADFARFAAAFARRYGDHIRYYQLWDEPNIAPHWGARRINPVAYTQMMRASAPAIRTADEDAVILAAALAPTVDRGHLAIDEIYFLQRMIAAGAAPFFDVVAVQPFGFGAGPADPRQQPETLNFSRAALIRRALVAAGLGDKPVWAVRYGWNRTPNSPWGAVTAEAQAAYAAGALDRGWREWPWLAAMGWVIDRPAEPARMPAWGFALTSPAGKPAPLFTALAAWQMASPTSPRTSPGWGLELSGAWAALLLIALVIGWRAVTAARLIDWPGGLARYRSAPVWVHGAAWGALLGVYYLATFPPLIGLCWLAAVLLCLAQPRVGLWLAVALIPFYYQHKEVQLVDGVLTVPPSQALAFALLPAVYFARQASGVRRHSSLVIRHSSLSSRPSPLASRSPRPSPLASRSPRPSPLAPRLWIWWELAPLLLLPLSLLAAANVWQWPAFGRGTLDLVIAPLLLWLAVRRLACTDSERRRVLAALVTGGVLAASIGLVGWLRGEGAEVDGIRRLVGPHFSPNHTALYLERSLLVGLALLIVASRRWRAAAALALLIVAAALLLTGSRGALLLGAPVGLVVLAGFALKRRPGLRRWLRMRRRALGVAAAGGAILLLLAVAWQRTRLANMETLELRLDVWQAALALWCAHFWAGVGPGGFFWSYPAYLRVGAVEVDQLHPHSVWLELVTMWGVGGLAWFTLCGIALTEALRAQGRASGIVFWAAAGACAGLAAGLAHAQTDTFLGLADLAAWNAVAWALATAPSHTSSNNDV